MVNGWMRRNWRRWLKELVVVRRRDGGGVNGGAVEGVLGRRERVGVGEGRESSERRRQRRIHGFRERKQRKKKVMRFCDFLEKFVFSFFFLLLSTKLNYCGRKR